MLHDSANVGRIFFQRRFRMGVLGVKQHKRRPEVMVRGDVMIFILEMYDQ